MKKNEIVVLAIKLLGIYMFIQGLATLGSSFGMGDFSKSSTLSLYFGVLIILFSGIILFLKAVAISKYILPDDENSISSIEISENFQAAVLRIIGIYVLVFSLPALVHLVGQMVQAHYAGPEIPDYLKVKQTNYIPLISQLVRCLLGVFLTLGAGPVIKVLGRFDKTIEKMKI